MMKIRMLCFVMLFTVFSVSLCHAEKPIGQVVGVDGDVTATRGDGESRELEIKSDIFLHDVIRSGVESRLQIIFNDDTLFAQGENSEVEINEYVYSPEEKPKNRFIVRLGKGIYRVITGKITELNPERFKVKTGRATIGIRGCELGFRVMDEFDLIMMMRIPPHKSILVDATAATRGRPMDAGRFLEIRDQSGVIVGDDGTLKNIALEAADYRKVLGGTVPCRAGLVQRASHRGRSTPTGGEPAVSRPGNDSFTQRQPLLLVGADTPPSSPFLPVGSGLPPLGEPLTNPENEFNADLVLGGPNNTDQLGDLLQWPPPDAPLSGSGIDKNMAPEPGAIYSGGAVGALYTGVFPAQRVIDETYMYDHIEGSIGLNQFDGHAYGKVIDEDATILGDIDFTLEAIPLASFGAPDTYSGYQWNTPLTDHIVGNDNLQQFVVVEHELDTTRTLTFFGLESESVPNSALAGGTVFTYDVKLLEQPPLWDAPSDPTDVQNVTLYLNTQTKTFFIPSGPNNLAIIAPMESLKFYGQESQGIASLHSEAPPASVGTPLFSAGGLAGFREIGTEQTADTGQSSYQGYAMATTFPEGGSPDMAIRHHNSVGFVSDTTADNEGHVLVDIDRDSPEASINVHLEVFEDGAAPAPTDIHLGPADDGGYVLNAGYDVYGAHFEGPDQHIDMVSIGGGQNWSYGPWMGEQSVDRGGGDQVEHVDGTYVVGDTLDQTGYDALVDGATSYMLSSPAGLGWAEADVGDDSFHLNLDGTCDMWVTIPGGGSQPTWGGAFSLSGGPDSLDFNTGLQLISPGGHLELTSALASFSGDFNGISYALGGLAVYEMTGNLVGLEGSGPPTGVIGDGHFEMNDGVTIDLLYGSDLIP